VRENGFSSARPEITAAAVGSEIRFFLNRPAYAEIQVLDAQGRIVAGVPRERMDAGWHRVRPGAGLTKGIGVYFFRCALDGGYKYVKRIVMVR
jgi:hypothetical protein